MNATAYIAGIVLQAVAGVIALLQVRRAPHRLPWLLIALSSLLIVVRRAAILEQALGAGQQLSLAEMVTLLISLLFFLGVVLMSRMFGAVVRAQEARVRSEAELKTTCENLQAVMNGARNLHLVYLDREFNFVRVNETYAHTCGYRPEEMVGKNHFALYPDAENEAIFTRARDTGEPVEVHDKPFEFPDQPERGVTYWDWALTPIKDARGAVTGLVFSLFETTQRRRTEEQLRRAQKIESIGQLAGGIAHDFRNQLQVILGFGETLARRGLVREEGRTMLDLMMQAAQRSAKTTGQLLAFGQREMLWPQVQSLRACVGEIARILPAMIGEDIRLVVRCNDEDDRVRIDSHLLQEAIGHLATNARDAMPEGGALIVETACVTLGPEARKIDPDLSEGPYVVVTVSDTGGGMDKATLERAFEPFFTTKEIGKGTGLGLPMVYGFAKQSGGAVSLQSEPGHGTTVQLYFPRVVVAPPPPQAAAPGARGGNETLLVVEDEPAVLSMAAQLLRWAGYRVLEAPDAESALPYLEASGPAIDMLVTDIVMPGMSGVALARQFLARHPRSAVLYISGYPGVELTRRGLEESAEILVKPFAAEYLLGRIRELLDARQPASGQGDAPK